MVLTFGIPKNTATDEAAELLAYWASTATGLSDSIYQQLAQALCREPE